MFRLKNTVFTRTGWELVEDSFDEKQLVTTGSNFMIGNGYLGYRGTFSEWDKNYYTACIVTDTYDMADGKWRELCNVPNTLFASIKVDGEECKYNNGNYLEYERGINLKNGLYFRNFNWQSPHNKRIDVKIEKISSYDLLHTLAMDYIIKVESDCELEVKIGIDGNVWSINGEHFQNQSISEKNGIFVSENITKENSINIICSQKTIFKENNVSEELVQENNSIYKIVKYKLKANDEIQFTVFSSIYTSNDVNNPLEASINEVNDNASKGYSEIKVNHEKKWNDIWSISDIVIEGDLESQVLLRFNLYHNIIATPAHSDRLPIGARGLSCQAYQGAAFWDEEIFNMPMFLYTRPEIARNILTYRYHTLDGAREKAKSLGYDGAFFAWISGKTGKELCPSFFFKDVLTGRKIQNHFNDWQIHISPDIVYAIDHYYKITGDFEYIEKYGAEIIFEVAKFLYSKALFNKFKNRYEFIRLLGPDEYHENVDNNTFTNYQARFALKVAVEIYKKLSTQSLDRLKSKIHISGEDYKIWQDMIEKIYVKEPDSETGLIEQFDGYFNLEDTTPSEIKKRLLDPGEYHGWPNGIAVHTQVLKQADVLQLFVMHNNYSDKVMKANYDYYEPRTEHGSSLSPSAYCIVAAKIGYVEKAFDYFKTSIGIDVFNTNKAVSGGTFIGGIHTASSGAAWLMMVKGFAGLEIEDEKIILKPVMPDTWKKVSFKIVYMSKILSIDYDSNNITIVSDSDEFINVKVNNEIQAVSKKSEARFEL